MDIIINSIYDFNEQIIQTPSDLPLQPLSKELKGWFEAAILEELNEFNQAWHGDDLTGQVDAIIDMIYFAVGRLQQMGLTREQALTCFVAVHTANMTKQRGVQPKRGNVQADAIKPVDWVSPENGIQMILFGGAA
jgi:predicted HAD superfamily Cof-like phosphohydrolase